MNQKFSIVEKKYTNLRMLPINPRIPDLDVNLSNIYYTKYSIYSEIKKIINLERKNLEVLYNLITSLADRFTASNDNIHIIFDDKEENLYVLEGNRRLMCMYLLEEFNINNNDWKDIDNYITNQKGKSNQIWNENWNKIKNCIIEYQNLNKHNFNNISITLVDRKIATEEELWQIVNNRHTAGSTGKSDFPRLLYLKRLAKEFQILYKNLKKEFKPKDIKKEVLKKIHFKYDRTFESLSSDINKALWCTWVISEYEKITNKKIGEYDIDISVIEICRTEIKINKNTLNSYLNLEYNYEDFIIEYKLLEKERMNKLIVFLVEKTENNKLTTRGLKSDEDNNELFFILFGDSKKDNFPKSFNKLISEIKSKPDMEISKLEKNLIDFDKDISNIKNKALLNLTHDDKIENSDILVKSIIYIWTYDALIVFDKTKYWNKNLPLLSLATMCRTTTDLLLAYIFKESQSVETTLRDEWLNLDKEKICFIFDLDSKNVSENEWQSKKNQMPFLREQITKLVNSNKISSIYRILNNMFHTPKTGIQFSKYFELFLSDLIQKKLISESDKKEIMANIISFKELVTAKYQYSPRSIFNNTIHNIYKIFEDENILNLWIGNIIDYIHFYNWFLSKMGWLKEKNI